MFEFRINVIDNKFENLKEEVNNGKLLLFAEWEVEDLINEAKDLIALINDETAVKELNTLIKKLNQYLYDVQGPIEKECSTL